MNSSHRSTRLRAWLLSMAATAGLLIAAAALATGSVAAQAAVTTNEPDYPPGSTVTISGDDSDGAGFLPGETVFVTVTGPVIDYWCSGVADVSGAWSCQITLSRSDESVGGYSYTAAGQTSGASQSGIFSDSGCPDVNGIGPKLASDDGLRASFATSGSTATYSFTSNNESSSGGIPGLIEYCVYTSPQPSSDTAVYVSPGGAWTAGTSAAQGFFSFGRPHGDPSNLPFDGTTQTIGTASWSGSVPAQQTILLHINDADECTALYGPSTTCFVYPSVAQDLTASKTAVPSFTRTYAWTITKTVDKTIQDIAAGGSATFIYTIAVAHDSGTDSGWQVNGVITVVNPNGFGVSGVNVTDTVDDGGTCTVAGGTGASIAAGSSAQFPYSCGYSSAPSPASGTNTATITWDSIGSPDSSTTATASFDFGSTAPKVVDGSVTVSDSLAGSRGTASYTQPNPITFTYPFTFSGDRAGTCTTHPNVATFSTSDTLITGSASQGVQVCVGADLQVSKTATPSFTRTYAWSVTKAVDKSSQNIAAGASATFNYAVTASETGFTDSGWQVNGNVTVSNPNDWESITANVADVIDNNGTCALAGGTGVVIPASGSQTLAYTCNYTSAPSPASGTNTATATWDAGAASTPDGTASGTAAYAFGLPTSRVNQTITVNDSVQGILGSLTASDQAPFTTQTYSYSRSLTGVAGTCTNYPNTANILETGQQSSQNVTVCVGSDLSVSKTAATSFTRTYAWNVTKAVDKSSQNIAAGASATFNYIVTASETGFTDSGWQVNGTITVSNPNDWESVTANLADVIDDNGTCAVAGATGVVIPASGSQTLAYTCNYTSAPSPASRTNTATATWDAGAASTPHGSASGVAAYAFGAPTSRVNQTITVNDSVQGVLGSLTASDQAPFTTQTYSYSRSLTGVTGTCTNYPNTANIQETGQQSSQNVRVCVGSDLSVSKTAATTFTRTYSWMIHKSVNKNRVDLLSGSATFNYSVLAAETGFTDSGWHVNGNITVSNPNDWESISANVADVIDNNGTCTVSGGTGVTVSPKSSVVLSYSCAYGSAPSPSSGSNTATASWDAGAASTPHGSASGVAAYAFGAPTSRVNQTITVTDSFAGTLGTLTATDQAPFTSQTFTYSRSISVTPNQCVSYPNTATITQTGQQSSQSVTVCGPVAGGLTMGFWQNKNGQGIITSGASTSGVCKSGTWLRQFAPFQDLSSSASCSAVAGYVYNVIKTANAGGSSMNAMLKAQMLATALDVYFSDPALGGNKINAPAAIGGLKVDLTMICGMLDNSSGGGSCSGTYANTGDAFGGASCLSVNQILTYAASQSNAGGTSWYGQNKAIQQDAKNTFDAINNQQAFTC